MLRAIAPPRSSANVFSTPLGKTNLPQYLALFVASLPLPFIYP